ncbi:MAG: aminoacyl-tRNA hydrolase [Bacteroidota bacterium]|nr:aminoacyl-tRNA hydrolase [Bacteroidota bacterium]
MKYLIVGLGNPGDEYTLTRHNIGFLILESLSDKLSISFSGKRYGNVAQGRIKNKQLILLKPDTYMNLSGKAVRYYMQEENISKENILIVTDDLALPTGRLRIKTKGSDGGHNGLKSIQELVAGQDYSRLRFGISNEFSKGKQVDYVLGKWSGEEWPIVQKSIIKSVEAIESFVLAGPAITMNKFNTAG